jgi:hypothetical protein
MFWLDPLEGIDPGKHSDEEEPLRRYIENVPTPDDDDAWPISEAQAWLDTPTVSTPFYFIIDLFVLIKFSVESIDPSPPQGRS